MCVSRDVAITHAPSPPENPEGLSRSLEPKWLRRGGGGGGGEWGSVGWVGWGGEGAERWRWVGGFMGHGASSFFVGGVISLVKSVSVCTLKKKRENEKEKR